MFTDSIFFLTILTVISGNTIAPAEPEFVSLIKNVTVSEGKGVRISCTVKNLGSHKVSWIHYDRSSHSATILAFQNTVITTDPRIDVTHFDQNEWSLVIRDVDKKDEGQYLCQINTPTAKTTKGTLHVVDRGTGVGKENDSVLTSSDDSVVNFDPISRKVKSAGKRKKHKNKKKSKQCKKYKNKYLKCKKRLKDCSEMMTSSSPALPAQCPVCPSTLLATSTLPSTHEASSCPPPLTCPTILSSSTLTTSECPTCPQTSTNPTTPTCPQPPPTPACPTSSMCPSPPTCSTPPTCPPPPICPTLPTCPSPPTCPTLPTCPPPPTCPTLPTCPPTPTCPTLPTCPSPPTCPTLPTCPPPPTCPALPMCPSPPTCPTIPTSAPAPACPSTTTKEVSTGCKDADTKEHLVTQDEIKFHSPGFPDKYENGEEYCWRFKAKNLHEKLSISFKKIQTEYGYDIIYIYEAKQNQEKGKENILLITSGDEVPEENIISKTNEIEIIFKTDANKQMKGFEASVTAVKKKDLPHFSWEEFSDGKINVTFSKGSPDNHTETINVKPVPDFAGSCVFQGLTENTKLTIASLYSDKSCKSLSQYAQISMISRYLSKTQANTELEWKRATFSIKDGQLQETTEEVFDDNKLVNQPIPPETRNGQQVKGPSRIEIKINLAYDRSILNKFKQYESGDSGIKKQLRQLFLFAKEHFEGLDRLGGTKIELLLKKDIKLIDKVINVKNSDLAYMRKFQTDNTEPVIVICGDFDAVIKSVTGLSYRSGACRNDTEPYGVGLVAYNENQAITGQVLAHEIEHMFGMTHHGHIRHDITNWYKIQGHRCYTESCPSPPPRENGKWSCTKNNKICQLNCSPGFSTIISAINCENGHFSSNLEKAACSPSVFLLTGGYGHEEGHRMDVYFSTTTINIDTTTTSTITSSMNTTTSSSSTIATTSTSIYTTTSITNTTLPSATNSNITTYSRSMRNMARMSNNHNMGNTTTTITTTTTDSHADTTDSHAVTTDSHAFTTDSQAVTTDSHAVTTNSHSVTTDAPSVPLTVSNSTEVNSISTAGAASTVYLVASTAAATTITYPTEDTTFSPVTCSKLPPELERSWSKHASIFFDGFLILCGGKRTGIICSSLNMEAENPQWHIHRISQTVKTKKATAVISRNSLFLFDTLSHSKLHLTKLPLLETTKFTQDVQFKYNALHYCVAQLDDDNVALLGGFNESGSFSAVTKYNMKEQTSSDLPDMKTARSGHACIKVYINGINWIVVSGGLKPENGKTNERLNLDGETYMDGKQVYYWEAMDDLNIARSDHRMIWTQTSTIIVLGGSSNGVPLDSIERLDWDKKSWQRIEQSLVKPNYVFGAIELPASLLECKINLKQACLNLPDVIHGTWDCDTGNTKCGIICDPGYISTLTHTTCNGGIWSGLDRIQCEPSVWLMFEEYSHSFYHPVLGHPTCSKPPPATIDKWDEHTTFVHKSHLYNCGGIQMESTCVSLNLQDDEFEWTSHNMDTLKLLYMFPSSIIMKHDLYIIHRNASMSTNLSQKDKIKFISEPKITDLRADCVVKLNEYTLITIDGESGNVYKYNVIEKTQTKLSKLEPLGTPNFACAIAHEKENTWLFVSGGGKTYKKTERLDLSNDTASWEKLGDLNDAREYHSMIHTEMGIVVLGGWKLSETCFTSPNYPSKYGNNIDTKYEELKVEDGDSIQIIFEDFDLERATSCRYDYLEFLDADRKRVGQLHCGSTVPKEFTISTSTAYFKFHSDYSVTRRGYKFCYQAVKNSRKRNYIQIRNQTWTSRATRFTTSSTPTDIVHETSTSNSTVSTRAPDLTREQNPSEAQDSTTSSEGDYADDYTTDDYGDDSGNGTGDGSGDGSGNGDGSASGQTTPTSSVKTVEILNFTSGTWSYLEHNLTTQMTYWRNKFVEVPASAFGCQTIPMDIKGCDGAYSYHQEYPGGAPKNVSAGETCHSVCEKEEGCMAWTWSTKEKQCRLHTTIGTTQPKHGSFSGFQTSCKPKCYAVIGLENGTSSMIYCNETNCYDLVQKEPREFEAQDKVVLCHEENEENESGNEENASGACEEISPDMVHTMCSLEPAVVTNSIKAKMGKRRHTRNACCPLAWG